MILTPPVVLENVSVKYRLPKERINSLKEFAVKAIKRRIEFHEFWALRDVNFHVDRGDILGIVGRNGAGKSTLLKLIARVMKPVQGRIIVQGRTAPLIELGTGFDPELTGKENVYLFGSILGMGRKEMSEKFEPILNFSELREFIDAPLRTYSSGMVTRLGFAIATEVSPEILLLDEILSVGDAGFQKKCLRRIDNFHKDNVTIIFVSHNLEQVKSFCRQALWLDQGQVRAWGGTREVLDQYEELLNIESKN